MFGFNKTSDKVVASPKCKFGPTEKLKNTYVVTFDTLMDERVWQLCPTSKLAVVKINGESVSDKGGFRSLTDFPNPFAYRMVCAYKDLAPVMGKDLAGTIVVYGDKTDKETVCVMLFPNNEVAVYGKDGLNQLNHASRRDLKYQMAKRQKYLDILNQNQR